MRLSGCLRWFGILLIVLAVCLLSIGGLEAAEWLSRSGAIAAVTGLGDAVAMKAVSHFLQYVFLTIPMFFIGFLAIRGGRRREVDSENDRTSKFA